MPRGHRNVREFSSVKYASLQTRANRRTCKEALSPDISQVKFNDTVIYLTHSIPVLTLPINGFSILN